VRRRPIQTLPALVHYVHRRYGEDIAQQALCVAYARRGEADLLGLVRYTIAVARRLERWGFSDRKTAWGHDHCWTMEGLAGTGDAEPTWGSRVGNPLALAIAREGLRALPAWVREWHLTEGFVYRAPCGHARRWLYPRAQGPARRVRCRLCDRERIAQHRAAARTDMGGSPHAHPRGRP
jgi:hypothetical protein